MFSPSIGNAADPMSIDLKQHKSFVVGVLNTDKVLPAVAVTVTVKSKVEVIFLLVSNSPSKSSIVATLLRPIGISILEFISFKI